MNAEKDQRPKTNEVADGNADLRLAIGDGRIVQCHVV